MSNLAIIKDLITPRQAAEILQIKPSTLACWRTKNKNHQLSYVKIGWKVFYKKEDVEKFMEKRIVVMGGINEHM